MIFELNTYRQILLLPPDSCLITSLLISVKKRHGFKKLQIWNFSPPRQHRKNPFWGYFEQNDFWAKYLPTDPLTASWLMSDHFPVDFSEKKAWFQKAPNMKFLPTPAASKKSILSKMIFELNTYRQILLLPPDSCLITSLLISVKKRHGFKKLQIWNFSPPRQHRKNHFEAILSKMIFELNTYRQILLLPPDSCLITSLLISVKKRHGFKKLQKWNFSPPRQHRKNPFWGYFEQNDFWAKYLPTDPLTASWLMSDHFAVDFSEKKAWFQKAPNMKFLPTPAASKKSILRLFWAKWFLS